MDRGRSPPAALARSRPRPEFQTLCPIKPLRTGTVRASGDGSVNMRPLRLGLIKDILGQGQILWNVSLFRRSKSSGTRRAILIPPTKSARKRTAAVWAFRTRCGWSFGPSGNFLLAKVFLLSHVKAEP